MFGQLRLIIPCRSAERHRVCVWVSHASLGATLTFFLPLNARAVELVDYCIVLANYFVTFLFMFRTLRNF